MKNLDNLKNTIWMSFDRIFRQLIAIVSTAVVMRYLGPAQVGEFNLIISFLSVFSILIALGTEEVVFIDLSKKQDKDEVITNAIALRFFGFIGYVFLSSLFFLFWNDLNFQLFFLLLFSNIYLVSETIDTALAIESRSRETIVIKNILSLVMLGLRFCAVYFKLTLPYFGMINLIEGSLLFFIHWRVIRSGRYEIHSSLIQFKKIRSYIVKGLPFFGSGLLVILSMQFDKIIMPSLSSFESLGYFSAASRITEATYFLIVAIGSSYMGSIGNLFYTEGRNSFLLTYNKLARCVLVLGLCISIVISALSYLVIPVLFGSKYSEAISILSVLAFTIPFVFLVSVRNKALVVEGKQNFILFTSACCFCSSLALNLLLVPKFGAKGAAWASVSSWLLNAILLPLFFSDLRHYTLNLITFKGQK